MFPKFEDWRTERLFGPRNQSFSQIFLYKNRLAALIALLTSWRVRPSQKTFSVFEKALRAAQREILIFGRVSDNGRWSLVFCLEFVLSIQLQLASLLCIANIAKSRFSLFFCEYSIKIELKSALRLDFNNFFFREVK